MRTCSVLCESTNITYMKAPLYRVYTQGLPVPLCLIFPCSPGFPVWPERGKTRPAALRGGSNGLCHCPRSGSLGTERNPAERRAGVPGLGREVAMPSRALVAQEAPLQGYSSLPASELLTAPVCPDLLHAFRDGYAADGHFPPSSLTEPINSTWLHNAPLNAWGVCWTSWWCCSIWLNLIFLNSSWTDINASGT